MYLYHIYIYINVLEILWIKDVDFQWPFFGAWQLPEIWRELGRLQITFRRLLLMQICYIPPCVRCHRDFHYIDAVVALFKGQLSGNKQILWNTRGFLHIFSAFFPKNPPKILRVISPCFHQWHQRTEVVPELLHGRVTWTPWGFCSFAWAISLINIVTNR